MLQNESVNEIYLPKVLHAKIIEHCSRKLNRQYLAKETAEQQAYGLIGGKLSKNILSIGAVIPLCKNFRNDVSVKKTMDSNVKKYAIPEKTSIIIKTTLKLFIGGKH